MLLSSKVLSVLTSILKSVGKLIFGVNKGSNSPIITLKGNYFSMCWLNLTISINVTNLSILKHNFMFTHFVKYYKTHVKLILYKISMNATLYVAVI